MSIRKPLLPEGDTWEVDRDNWPEKGRVLRVKWWSSRPYDFRHVVASESFKPRWGEWAYLFVYIKGRRRLAADARDERRERRENRAIERVRAS